MKIIVYKEENGNVVTATPTDEVKAIYPIDYIAKIIVPKNHKYAIVNVSDLPQDIPQEAWLVDEADLSDGIGGEFNEF